MAISYNKVRENYTIVPNLVINDKQLPMQSKFIYIYMLSKPDGWNFYQKAMCDDLGMSGDTLKKYLDVLISSGWITSGGQVRENGTFKNIDYILNDLAVAANTDGYFEAPEEEPEIESSIDYSGNHHAIKEKRNYVTKKRREPAPWIESYDIYCQIVDDSIMRVIHDEVTRAKYESWYPNIHYENTVRKTADWWRSDIGWAYCKKKSKGILDMAMRIKNNLDKNRVYNPFSAIKKEEAVKHMDAQLDALQKARRI